MSLHHPVPRLPRLRRLIPLLAALALAALLLASAPPAHARGRAHTTHQRRSCAASRAAAAAKGRRPARSSACKTHVRRTSRGVRLKVRHVAAGGVLATQHATPGAVVASPSCDDGSAPASQGCSDGSEASRCPAGSTLDERAGVDVCVADQSPAGGEFACEDGASECSSAFALANCQNGHAAVKGADGSYACADGSEPACEEAFTPVFEGDRLIACEPSQDGEEEEPEG